MTDVQASSTVERELAIEQAHVDLVYARLAEATRSAQQLARAGRAVLVTRIAIKYGISPLGDHLTLTEKRRSGRKNDGWN